MKIRFYGRYNKGRENEYLAFMVDADCNLHEYIVYDSTFDGNGDLSNLLPHMYRFPLQDVTKGSYVFLYIHDLGERKTFEVDKDGDKRYRFAWGLASTMSVFNKEKDFIHIAEVNQTKVAIIEGK